MKAMQPLGMFYVNDLPVEVEASGHDYKAYIPGTPLRWVGTLDYQVTLHDFEATLGYWISEQIDLYREALAHIEWVRTARKAAADDIRTLRDAGCGKSSIDSVLLMKFAHLRPPRATRRECLLNARDNARVARHNYQYFRAGGVKLPCGADDSWFENHVEAPRHHAKLLAMCAKVLKMGAVANV